MKFMYIKSVITRIDDVHADVYVLIIIDID